MSPAITHLPADDPTLAARYLADQLSEEERAAFEARMLADPAVLHEVEVTARFKAGLALARERGQLGPLLVAERRRPQYLALAAMLALVAIGIGVWRSSDTALVPWIAPSLQELARGDAPLPASAQFTLLRVRSDGQIDARIPLPAQRQGLWLRVLPDSGTDGSRHNVMLVRDEEPTAAQALAPIANLTANEAGYVEFFVDSASLQPGLYRLTVEPDAAAAEAETFLIQFTAGDARP